jgi:hypothetical protein
MEPIKNISRNKIYKAKNRYLHSKSHFLADELATKLDDSKHFGFYLKMATTMSPDILKKLCGQVLENKNVDNKGKLFAYLIKQHNQSLKDNQSINL